MIVANPRALYQAVQNNTSIQGPTPVATAPINILDPNALQTLHDRIKNIREAGFDQIHTSPDGKKTLIKVNAEDFDVTAAGPTEEVDVQSLRYLRGMLIIAQNDERLAKTDINNIYQVFLLRQLNEKTKNPTEQNEAANLKWLHDEFANLIKASLDVTAKKSRQQLTMARDLGIMLEDHPAVCTISSFTTEHPVNPTLKQDKVTIEVADHLKISPSYYDAELTNLDNKEWFKSAKKLAGFKKADQDTWLEKFLTNNFDTLKTLGVAAPPSARWLPLPANNQLIQTHVADADANTKTLGTGITSKFIRMGIPVSFDVKNNKYKTQKVKSISYDHSNDYNVVVSEEETIYEQKRLAKAQLKEIIGANLDQAKQEFNDFYKGILPPDSQTFIVSYQTLLAPHHIEASFYKFHKDNNAKFIEIAKEAMNELAAENKDPNIMYSQTNAAVNKVSDMITSKEFSEDKNVRDKKLHITANLFREIALQNHNTVSPTDQNTLSKITNVISGVGTIDSATVKQFAAKLEKGDVLSNASPEVRKELSTRLQAAFYLRRAINKESPYADLPNYQRNLHIAGLENLSEGKQSLKLSGCKSARDRTAVFAAAVKTMMENPESMHNWKALNDGIIKSLKQGHHFRAMIYHIAIVKVDDVHRFISKQLPEMMQAGIKNLKQFSKRLAGTGMLKKISHGISKLTNSTMFLFDKLSVTKSSIVENNHKDLDKAKNNIKHILRNEVIAMVTKSSLNFDPNKVNKMDELIRKVDTVHNEKELNALLHTEVTVDVRKKIKKDIGTDSFTDNSNLYERAKALAERPTSKPAGAVELPKVKAPKS